MLRPYNRLLRRYPQIGPAAVERLDALDPEERIPIAGMLELLRGIVQLTGDEDLGLKAAREIAQGDYGVIEFMVNSATSMRAAVELLGRYLPLVNDALRFSLDVEGERASIRLESSIALPRAAADFQSAAFYVATLQRSKHIIDPDYEAWFKHPEPENLEEYQRTFAPGRLRFSAPFDGFVFSAKMLDLPLTAADPDLHAVLRKYADVLLAELPKTESLTDRVREFLIQQLQNGEPNVARAARALHMSRRTLARRLEREGTSFKLLLDDTRRRLALRYVVEREIGITEIAFLLGFSHTGAFFRAFKRWTGSSPGEYRRGQRLSAGEPLR